ncbi:hypothetical protein J6590_036566 [Homalodisca vitripennis]|nr:hypothetical protein J6590_036566 [Homalodisca vitripennis]
MTTAYNTELQLSPSCHHEFVSGQSISALNVSKGWEGNDEFLEASRIWFWCKGVEQRWEQSKDPVTINDFKGVYDLITNRVTSSITPMVRVHEAVVSERIVIIGFSPITIKDYRGYNSLREVIFPNHTLARNPLAWEQGSRIFLYILNV